MKKKILGVLLLVFSAFLLVGCSSKNNLSGEYYWVRGADYLDKQVVINADNDSGTMDIDGFDCAITSIDKNKKQFFVNGYGREYVFPYTYEDNGTLRIDMGSSTVEFYKKDSGALKKAIEEEKNN